ncbi:hypothetical protein BC830DRAFT_1227630 [Chytriomyces sp. MP71]|nr:hypothetical protein BC830DRAFT_1227630 [Chytriomyces sp. MP71]
MDPIAPVFRTLTGQIVLPALTAGRASGGHAGAQQAVPLHNQAMLQRHQIHRMNKRALQALCDRWKLSPEPANLEDLSIVKLQVLATERHARSNLAAQGDGSQKGPMQLHAQTAFGTSQSPSTLERLPVNDVGQDFL